MPFTNIEKCTVEKQCVIQLHHFSPNPHLLNIYSKKSQLIDMITSLFNVQLAQNTWLPESNHAIKALIGNENKV
jgi:hypothetical protein